MKILYLILKLVILFGLATSAFSLFKSQRRLVSPILKFSSEKRFSVVLWIFLLAFGFLLVRQFYLQFLYQNKDFKQYQKLYDQRQWFDEQLTAKGGIYDRSHTQEKILASYDIDKSTGMIERHYPYGEATSHLLGYSDIERDRTGLEKDFLDHLMGRSWGSLGQIKTAVINGLFRINPRGNDLVLTIDADLQSEAYRLMEQRRGAVVVMIPKTGDVLALVSTPGFDPSEVSQDSTWKRLVSDDVGTPLFNRALKGQYPPGSTFKIFMAAAAMENGISEKFECKKEGAEIPSYRKRVFDHARHVHGKVDMEKAIVVSCNQYFGQLGMLMGAERLVQYSERAKLGQLILWNASNEEFQRDFVIRKSLFHSTSEIDSYSEAFSAIGQDQVLVTPMYMTLFTCAIANGGKMPRPKLELGRWSRSVGSVMGRRTARKLRDMMQKVVNEVDGTAYGARVSGLEIAGKTGTAEVAQGRPHSWFTSFAPADDPKIVITVICENSGYGASVAAPIVKRLYLKAKELGYFE